MNILFSAFDVFPTAKGSTTRIAHTLEAIQEYGPALTLACLGYGDMPRFQQEGDIFIRRCLAMHPNFLKRSELFGDFLFDVMDSMEHYPDVIHFRDVWSGIPLLAHPGARSSGKIFEVNGFLSIELPVHYPRLYQKPVFMSRIRAMEDYCLAQADHIITVSQTNADYIQHRLAAPKKITIVRNIGMTHSYESSYTCTPGNFRQGRQGYSAKSTVVEGDQGGANQDQQFFLYAGTLTPWQGVPTLLKAFALIADREDLCVMLACSTKKFLRPIRKLIKKLRLKDRVEIKIGLAREELADYYQEAVCTVVPLTRCDRNELQGCCPLKILESMAAGTPVIASNLAVCRELIEHGSDGWLVTPDSPRALANAMLTLLDDSELTSTLGSKAQQKIARHFNQKSFTEKLCEVYSFSEI